MPLTSKNCNDAITEEGIGLPACTPVLLRYTGFSLVYSPLQEFLKKIEFFRKMFLLRFSKIGKNGLWPRLFIREKQRRCFSRNPWKTPNKGNRRGKCRVTLTVTHRQTCPENSFNSSHFPNLFGIGVLVITHYHCINIKAFL